jgi:hypothetical protein
MSLGHASALTFLLLVSILAGAQVWRAKTWSGRLNAIGMGMACVGLALVFVVDTTSSRVGFWMAVGLMLAGTGMMLLPTRETRDARDRE